jgi:hypothetical protein
VKLALRNFNETIDWTSKLLGGTLGRKVNQAFDSNKSRVDSNILISRISHFDTIKFEARLRVAKSS